MQAPLRPAARVAWPARVSALGRWPFFLLFFGIGALMGLAYPPFDLAPLGLLGLAVALGVVPLLPRSAAWAGWALGYGHFAVALHWIVEPFLVDVASHGWMAPFALVFMAGGLALFWALAFGLGARLGRLGIALALVAAEMARAHVLSGFPWAIPSHGLIGTLGYWPAAWVGPFGVLLGLVLAAWALGRAHGAFGAALFAAVLALYVAPLPAPPAPEAAAPLVRLVQPNAPQDEKWDPARMPVFFDRMMAATRAGDPVDLTIWPETAVPFLMHQGARYYSAMAEAARGGEVMLGLRRVEGKRIFNSAVVVGPDGDISAPYDKAHLVPFGEYIPLGHVLERFGLRGLAQSEGGGFSSGGVQPLVETGAGAVRVLICYEGIFPEEIATEQRPDMLVVITNDAWFGGFAGPFQHLALAQARAVEFGLPVLRSANTGVSAVIDARGRILAQLGMGEEGYLDHPRPPLRPVTLYARTGDWGALVALLTLFALVLTRARKFD